MRKIGVAALALAAMVATLHVGLAGGKFDGKVVAAEWYQAHMQCRLPIEGQTNKQADAQCAKRDKLTLVLRRHHFCFDSQEQEWAKCKAN
jgi:hypothetical protein